jgi:hypothetical protein
MCVRRRGCRRRSVTSRIDLRALPRTSGSNFRVLSPSRAIKRDHLAVFLTVSWSVTVRAIFARRQKLFGTYTLRMLTRAKAMGHS